MENSNSATSIIQAIQATPIPIMLTVVGLFILVLAFVTKIGGIIEVSSEQKRWAIPIGLFVLVLGLILNFSSVSPGGPEIPNPTSSSPPIVIGDPSPRPKNVGWIRLGATRGVSNEVFSGEALIATNQPVTITPMQVPAINDQVEIISGVNVRIAPPKPPDYNLQDKVSVLTANQKVLILEIKSFPDPNKSSNSTIVWARVGLP